MSDISFPGKWFQQAGDTEHLPNSKISRTAPEAQAKSEWVPPAGVLGELVERAWTRSLAIAETAGPAPNAPPLAIRLRQPSVAIIAEIKRASPSRGDIRPGLDSARQAALYERGGASAISVLTEPQRFGGSLEDLRLARTSTSLPLLRKDFHVTAAQLVEARQAGASAALVIVRAIAPPRLRELAHAAGEAGLEILFEVRDERELDRALEAGARMIGVNNRNLETLEIDPSTAARIVPLIPAGCVAVAESGYSTRAQIEEAGDQGADAVLIGTSLSAADDPVEALQRLSGVEKKPRRG